MKDVFTRLVLGVALALMVGWVLIIGRVVILPVVASIVVAYVVIGLSQLIGRVPGLDRAPPAARYAASGIAIGLALTGVCWLIITNLAQVTAVAPRYQAELLAAIQATAARLGVENEPSWHTLRQDLLARVDLRRVVVVTLGSVATIVASFLLIMIYAAFLLVEKDAFAGKIARLSGDPEHVARIQRVIGDINSRIGAYLGMKTLINITLALFSYGIMRYFGIEFAAFWAILIGLFNYIPYVGSYLGVGFPTVVAIAQFGALWPVASFVLAMSAIQLLLGNFIEPWLMGNSLNLSPFVILVSLVAWALIWGVAGAILSVPIMAILVIVFSEFDGTRPIAILLSKDGDVGGAPTT